MHDLAVEDCKYKVKFAKLDHVSECQGWMIPSLNLKYCHFAVL